jgi:hypothetical protein
MKLLNAAIVLVFLAASSLCQNSIREGLKVNGLALGATYAATVKAFGKPLRDVTSRRIDECIGSRTRTLTYPGLKVELVEGERNAFTVFGFEVTSAKWDVSGIKIGDPSAVIQKRFGTTGRTVDKDRNGPIWFYEMTDENPGGSNFYFRNGKLIKVNTGFEMC